MSIRESYNHPQKYINHLRSNAEVDVDIPNALESMLVMLEAQGHNQRRLSKLVEGDEDLNSPSVRTEIKEIKKRLTMVLYLVSATIVIVALTAVATGAWVMTA